MNRKIKIILPLLLATSFIVGYSLSYLGRRQQKEVYFQQLPASGNTSLSKIDQIIRHLDNSYYKKVNKDSIVEAVIPEILKSLDPHTAYFSTKEMKRIREDMQGHFSGIGVQFIQYEDTIMVVRAIPNGPSQRAGILAGDRIVVAGRDTISGHKIKTDSIMKILKGKSGTKVSIGVKRPSEDKLLYFDVIRGDVSVPSVDFYYMLNHKTAYIKVNQFGYRTFEEFLKALEELRKQNMQELIVDLRGNPGGLLGVCIKMLNEFLAKGDLIVYTKGLHSPRVDKKANGNGFFKELPLVVLIDSYSASASEIFAGAIQDHDRGVIVGRRSFGKGLVQEQIEYSDGSALRLTVAEYFTPSGRNIQKPFKMGDKDTYDKDITKRYEHGEFSVADSTQFADSLKFKTDKGRLVYGGGGVMPDIFVPLDTTFYSKYYEKLQQKFIVRDFSYHFADKHRETLSKMRDYKQMELFIRKEHYMQQFVQFAAKKGVKKDARGFEQSKKVLGNQILALIVRNILDNEGFYPIYQRDDVFIEKALQALQKQKL